MNTINSSPFYLHFIERWDNVPAWKKLSFRPLKELAVENGYAVKTVWHPVVDPGIFFKHFIKSIKEFNNLFCFAQLNISVVNVTGMGKKLLRVFAKKQLELKEEIERWQGKCHPGIIFCKTPPLKVSRLEFLNQWMRNIRDLGSGLKTPTDELFTDPAPELLKLRSVFSPYEDEKIAVCAAGQEALNKEFLRLLELRKLLPGKET